MPEIERLDYSQPANDLTAIGDAQRKRLIVKMITKRLTLIPQQILMQFLMVMSQEKEQVFF